MTPFDFVNQIMQGKKQLIVDELTEKDYIPFIVNKTLSYQKDCIMYANEMNSRHFIDKKMQNDFLLMIIRSKKRPFIKWAKSIDNDDLQSIKTYFGFSDKKAKDALLILNKNEIDEIKDKTSTGGIKNTK
jgi:hypothetical protein